MPSNTEALDRVTAELIQHGFDEAATFIRYLVSDVAVLSKRVEEQDAKIAVLEADKEKLQTDLDAEREFLKQERAYHAAGLKREERRERDH